MLCAERGIRECGGPHFACRRFRRMRLRLRGQGVMKTGKGRISGLFLFTDVKWLKEVPEWIQGPFCGGGGSGPEYGKKGPGHGALHCCGIEPGAGEMLEGEDRLVDEHAQAVGYRMAP